MITKFVEWFKGRWANCDRVRTISVIAGITLGASVSWYLNIPVPPWIEIHEVQATYARGSKVVNVSGSYTAARICSRLEQGTMPGSPEPLVWRQEVRGTGAEVVQYAPRPASPTLEVGTHSFVTEIPLNEGISPDGWSVAVIVSCDTEPYAVRSKSVAVEYLPAQSS